LSLNPNLKIHSNIFLAFVTCTNGQTCTPQYDCPDITRLTSKGHLTPEEKLYMRTKFCNKLNRLNYFCCDTGDTVINETPKQVLPSPPVCGAWIEDKVNF